MATFEPATPAPAKPNRLPLLIVIGVLILGLITALVLFLAGEDERPLTVQFGLLDSDGGVSCDEGGGPGYNDIGPGMPITVRNEEGTLIGSGSLPDTGDDEYEPFGCIWTVQVMVPEGHKQYAVEGGDRGEVTFSSDKLEGQDWIVEVGVGD